MRAFCPRGTIKGSIGNVSLRQLVIITLETKVLAYQYEGRSREARFALVWRYVEPLGAQALLSLCLKS